MNLFFESKFLSLLTAFRKNHSKQIALNMTEKQKHAVEKGKMVGTISMDLSKAFNTPNLSLPLVKLNAYGFSAIRDKSCSKLFLGTISKVNIKNNFSEWC